MNTTSSPLSPRLVSLDAYRGFIMVVLAFNAFGLAKVAELHLEAHPDSVGWKYVLGQFEHGEWVGWNFWDLIMPSFMFMVGMAMPFSLARRAKEGESTWQTVWHVLVRTLVLVLLGIFLMYHSKPKVAWTLVNTLSQIGLCYPLVFLCWNRGFGIQGLAAAGSLLVTWLLFVVYGGTGGLGPGVTAEWAAEHQSGIGQAWWKCANVAHAFDVWFLNLFPQPVPFTAQDGGYQTLNFLPALVTMIAGLMCGEWVRTKEVSDRQKLRVMVIAGTGLLLLGLVWGHSGFCPIIKRIWTPSFALICTGCCTLMLSAFYYVVDVKGFKAWATPLVIAGSNSIALYCMTMLLRGWTKGIWERYLGKDVFLAAGPLWAPALQAIAIGATFWLITYWLWRNKLFIKI